VAFVHLSLTPSRRIGSHFIGQQQQKEETNKKQKKSTIEEEDH